MIAARSSLGSTLRSRPPPPSSSPSSLRSHSTRTLTRPPLDRARGGPAAPQGLPDFKSLELGAEAAGAMLVLGVIGSRVGGAFGKISGGITSLGLNAIRMVPGPAMLGQKKWLILAISIIIDGAGMLSYLIPGLGEAEDIIEAPISALLVQALYGSYLITSLDFIEEALPFTDIIPTATLAWFIEYTTLGNGLRGVLQFRSHREKEAAKKK